MSWNVTLLLVTPPAGALVAGCGFEPDIDPLVLATAPPNPFSDFGPDAEAVDSISLVDAARAPDLSPVAQTSQAPEFPMPLAWLAGAMAVVTLVLSGLTFPRIRESDRPPILALVFIGVLVTVTTVLVELLFVVAEIIMLSSGFGETPAGVVLGLILAALGLFLLNFDLAYWIYVYRVASAPIGEEVRLNLRFWDGWGLSPQDEGK